MSLHRIETLGELVDFMPSILAEKQKVGRLWEPVDLEEFAQVLIKNFRDGFYFGELRNGELVYLYTVLRTSVDKQACLWLVYHNKKFYNESKTRLQELKRFFKGLGFTSGLWTSGILRPSYDRWVRKQGAKLYTRTYLLEF